MTTHDPHALAATLTYDDRGLIPAVVQQYDTGEVLMVAYMNAESVARTLTTGYTWFWSRSRQSFWKKGETSGHLQAVREVRYDCDADCLLVLVDQTGVACHTGERSCFFRTLGEPAEAPVGEQEPADAPAAPALGEVLDGLWAVLEQRQRDLPEGSYTTTLLSGPQDQLLKKIAEEAGEVIMAAKDGDAAHLRYEVTDLVYHLLVVMLREGITLDDLAAELDSRRG
jgi:phosphoribosyl-ATP pyrophosphohydrolase/phosphoribosyl-AMP cyclohydrolase